MAGKNLPSASEPVTNIVLVGRTGNGKSATANTLLGQTLFTSRKQAGGVTKKCEMYRAAIQDGPIINVIDTPGLFDLSMKAEVISKEIISCLTMAEEGIHAVLYVLSAKSRISEEEKSTLNKLQGIFESKILDYLIVVFTGGDELEDEGQTLEDYLGDGCPEYLENVLRLCGGRKLLINNKTQDNEKKANQLKELMGLINDVVKQNDGKPYTNKMHREIKEENDKLREREREAESKDIPEDELFLLKAFMHLEHQKNMSTIQEQIEHLIKQTAATPRRRAGIHVDCSIM